MNVAELAKTLVLLGCPQPKSEEMAAQLDKRARQLAKQKNRSYEDALTHLLSLMKQGWAAQGNISPPIAAQEESPPQPEPAPTHPSIQPWPTAQSEQVGDFRIFTIRAEIKASPRTGQNHDFYVIDCRNWVNVIAITPNDELILVEQYRHGSGTIELEIPGGVMDPDDTSPEAAACRELREETGYEGETAQIIGRCFPNPAIMSNTCFTVLIRNSVLKHPLEFDASEDIVTHLLPLAQIPNLIATGRIQHSLVIAALSHFTHHGGRNR